MPVWDVTDAPVDEQFDRWCDIVARAFVPLSTVPTPDSRVGFTSRVEQRSVGGLTCSVLSSRPQNVRHGIAEVRRTVGDYYYVNLQLTGESLVEHPGRRIRVRPGQLTVVDTRAPYRFICPADFKIVSFQLRRSPDVDPSEIEVPGVGAVLDTRDGIGRVVSAMMRQVWEMAADDPAIADDGPPRRGDVQDTLWERAFAATVSASMPSGSAADIVTDPAALRRAVETYVASRSRDGSLSAASVCAYFGISERSLQKLFSASGTTFAAHVRHERLVRCAAALTTSPTRSIAATAAEFGFDNAASFSRAFRREFGSTPSEYQRTARSPS
ncbi:helix-turn-helix domain-containing protein [Rhodococcus sp. USK13]|uniref:helix-turn-helix domain-containing protein n=1 Tax=Rhodococcus sp. USK13 TaxID=2806442 RepID=UPI001BD03AFD|nr:helix-turn-helix domain-containing protein [Rhodococcus sp. USK13]